DLVALVTDLAGQLDDEVFIDSHGDELLIARIPASHRAPSEWACALLRNVVMPLAGTTTIRAVMFQSEAHGGLAPPRGLAPRRRGGWSLGSGAARPRRRSGRRRVRANRWRGATFWVAPWDKGSRGRARGADQPSNHRPFE